MVNIRLLHINKLMYKLVEKEHDNVHSDVDSDSNNNDNANTNTQIHNTIGIKSSTLIITPLTKSFFGSCSFSYILISSTNLFTGW